MSKHQSAQFQNELFSLDPEWDKGFDMDLPGMKTPFPDTDGKRGFVFCGPRKALQAPWN